MKIQFEKAKDKYIGFAQITDVCAIHVVRTDSGRFDIFQSHVDDGNYAAVQESTNVLYPKVVDLTLEEKVFPLYLKFVSDTEVIDAEIIS